MAGLVLAAAVLTLATGCAGDPEPSSTSTPTVSGRSPLSPSPGSPLPAGGVVGLATARFSLRRVASFDSTLTGLAVREGEDALYVTLQSGQLVSIRDGLPETVLDLSEEISTGGEQGLLGLAFSPDGRFLYLNFTDPAGHTHVVELAMSGDAIDPGSRREVLFVEQPYPNHNGGNLAFGPDGYLYIGLGDGGSGGDPEDRAQSLSQLLGKMLRIDPRPDAGHPYGIPPDNPFVGREGARPENWAHGLRNPWRYSFDPETGDLWIGDVGQSAREEVDLQPAGSPGGENYGWNRLEGTEPFEGDAPPDAVPPVHEYGRDVGGTIIGGYVYRGSAIPALRGAYVFGDLFATRLMAIRVRNGKVVDRADVGPPVESVTSFGEDLEGELYVLTGGGELFKMVP